MVWLLRTYASLAQSRLANKKWDMTRLSGLTGWRTDYIIRLNVCTNPRVYVLALLQSRTLQTSKVGGCPLYKQQRKISPTGAFSSAALPPSDPTRWVRAYRRTAYCITPHWPALHERSRRMEGTGKYAPIRQRRIRASRPEGARIQCPPEKGPHSPRSKPLGPPRLASPRRSFYLRVRRQSCPGYGADAVFVSWYKE